MHLFHSYQSPKRLPDLASSRSELLERVVRILESGQPRHIILRGKPGSGRHTLAHAIFQFGPSLKRRHRFRLSASELATALYEPVETSEFFRELSLFTTGQARALILLDAAEPVTESIEKHESRRLTRFFRDLIEPHNLRCTVIADDEGTARLLGVSSVLRTIFTVVDVPSLDEHEVRDLLNQRGIDQALGDEAVSLVTRFLPKIGLPGGVLQLMSDAEALASQQHETAN